MRDDDFIVSKADLKGRITYSNKVFAEYSGFSESEFMGKQHNIVRHPDMPRCVFKLLWQHIESGQEIFAYVKNLCKDGSFYWVLANVTPSLDDQGRVVGYYSVRRKPNAKALSVVVPLYKQLLQIEQNAGSREAIPASLTYLQNLLKEKGVSYERFILDLQAL
ncbi:PAS domain-containing protein [Limnohabitans sp. 63ED37-2]|uniref:PAS domain-containing protein n=1 Tax=Limnohabitans sp. 63ED37-2 TaxID=1678128 RepID=UPI0012E10ABF|nr:PAS domain-containing protein [Limnohabitans sp. 63ED37-2]